MKKIQCVQPVLLYCQNSTDGENNIRYDQQDVDVADCLYQ